MDRSNQIDTFYRLTQVSRETIISLKEYENTLINANTKLNLIGKSTIKDRKIPLKIKLIEKSPKKVKFLTDLSSKLNLDV